MKLISLNMWAGTVYEPLVRFIKEESINTDIFCFQEVLFGDSPEFLPKTKARINIFHEIENELTDFTSYTHYAPTEFFQDESLRGVRMGQAIFVRKSILVDSSGGFQTYTKEIPSMELGGKATGNCQWIHIGGDNKFLVGNVHGMWQRGIGKADTPERIEQSQILKNFLANYSDKKILCGDFNLLPDSKSVAIISEGMKNLIQEHGITSTRSEFYEKPDRYADYIFTSPDTSVSSFVVSPAVVSDHLPLLLEFN